MKHLLKCLGKSYCHRGLYWEITIDRKQDWVVRVGGQLRLRHLHLIILSHLHFTFCSCTNNKITNYTFHKCKTILNIFTLLDRYLPDKSKWFSFSSLAMLSDGILVNLLLLSTRYHKDRSRPLKAMLGMEFKWLLLISSLQAPEKIIGCNAAHLQWKCW